VGVSVVSHGGGFFSLKTKGTNMTICRKVANVPNRIQGGQPQTTAERTWISPDRAQRLLEGNIDNRPLMKQHVKAIQQIIERKEFVFNGEPIIISASGRVLDGQHRLMACVAAGMPIETLLVTGVPSDVFATIDQGKQRSCQHILQMSGEVRASRLASAIRFAWVFCKTGQVYDGGNGEAFTPTIAMQFLEKNPTIRDSVQSCARFSMYPRSSLLAMLHFMASFVDAQLADDMVDVVNNGGERNRGFNVLRETIISARVDRINMTSRMLAAKTIRAFNAERTNKDVKILKYHRDSSYPVIEGLDYKMIKDLADV